jgi:hypothetical protein
MGVYLLKDKLYCHYFHCNCYKGLGESLVNLSLACEKCICQKTGRHYLDFECRHHFSNNWFTYSSISYIIIGWFILWKCIWDQKFIISTISFTFLFYYNIPPNPMNPSWMDEIKVSTFKMCLNSDGWSPWLVNGWNLWVRFTGMISIGI